MSEQSILEVFGAQRRSEQGIVAQVKSFPRTCSCMLASRRPSSAAPPRSTIRARSGGWMS
jgi:hypothetical protein